MSFPSRSDGSNLARSSGETVTAVNPGGVGEKPRTFGGSLRVVGDVRRDVEAANRRSLAVFSDRHCVAEEKPRVAPDHLRCRHHSASCRLLASTPPRVKKVTQFFDSEIMP
jgi:hypothetical protein